MLKAVSPSEMEVQLHEKFGEEYYKIFNYSSIEVFGDYSILFVYKFDPKWHKLPDFEGSELEILQQSIDYVNGFTYSRNKSNPNDIKEVGVGNCQASSLLLGAVLDKHGIENDLVVEENHMYNKVVLEDSSYEIDLSIGSLIKTK